MTDGTTSTPKKLRVAILEGGPSHEHEVSLASASHIRAHLPRDRYVTRQVRISRQGEWEIPLAAVAGEADIAFIAMHGAYGEDGTLQGELAAAGVPYTGSDALTSALAMNKFVSGQVLHRANITVPISLLVHRTEWDADSDRVLDRVQDYFGYPFVLKPNASGSSVGVAVAVDRDSFVEGLHKAFSLAQEVLAQQYIGGREFTCGVLDVGFARSALPLLPTEIIVKRGGFFDYRSKYEPGGVDEVTPPEVNVSVRAELQRIAVAAHRALGCFGISRTDMILDSHGRIFALEVNTIPGFTEGSLIPRAAEASGFSFPELLEALIASGLSRR